MTMPTFCVERFPTARKRHRCCECRGFVEPFDIYQHVSGMWDGDFNTFKTCPHCLQARDFYIEDLGSRDFRDPDDGQFCFGQLFEDMREAADESNLYGTGLKFRAYRYIIEARMRYEASKDISL